MPELGRITRQIRIHSEGSVRRRVVADVPVADQLCFLGLSAREASYQRQVRYLHAGPADLQHGNERSVIAELEPRAGRRTTETADEHKRETERHHHETCTTINWLYRR